MHLLAGFVSSSSLSLLEQCYIKIVCHACLSGFTRFARSNMIITSGKFLHGCTRSRFIIEHHASTGRCYVLMICKICFDSARVGGMSGSLIWRTTMGNHAVRIFGVVGCDSCLSNTLQNRLWFSFFRRSWRFDLWNLWLVGSLWNLLEIFGICWKMLYLRE